MHSVRIELAKLILVGTRITYQATGDAGYAVPFIMQYFLDSKMDPSRFFRIIRRPSVSRMIPGTGNMYQVAVSSQQSTVCVYETAHKIVRSTRYVFGFRGIYPVHWNERG